MKPNERDEMDVSNIENNCMGLKEEQKIVCGQEM